MWNHHWSDVATSYRGVGPGGLTAESAPLLTAGGGLVVGFEPERVEALDPTVVGAAPAPWATRRRISP